MNVLLVEDDPTLQRGLNVALAGAGHRVAVAADGNHADTLLAAECFDLVVLDLGLPRMDGIEVLGRLRRRGNTTPVMILSARDRPQDRVRGLDAGADDYMIKPFDLAEFEARVRTFMRRGQASTVTFGALTWSWESRQARVGKEDLVLSGNETTVLESLLQAPGKIIAKGLLARRLGAEGVAAVDNVVEVYIHHLRKKLAAAGIEIRTVRGVGYLLRRQGE